MKSTTGLSAVLIICLLLPSCAWFEQQSSKTKQGTGIGSVVGGIAGLIIDSSNTWRGGVIDAAIGAVSGGIIGNIVDHSAQLLSWQLQISYCQVCA
jgi:uncharacterized protein YcfJ